VRIALFAPYDLAVPGGITSHIRSQARSLRKRGHLVNVYGPASAPPPNGEVALAGSFTLHFGGTASGAAFDPRIIRRVERLFGRERFDIVHVHEPLMPLLPWAAVWFANAPVVGTFHVHREAGHRWYPVARPLLQRLMRRIDARIAVSSAAEQTVAHVFPGHYDTIPNGIELSRFQKVLPRPPQMPARGPVVLHVGRLEPRKGVAALVEAMAVVQQRIQNVSLVIVGDGPDARPLAELAARTGVRASFIPTVTDDELPAFYQAADVVCAPARGGESFGIVLLEALAAGKPVVASRIDGYVAAVGASSCVRFVEPGNAAALAAETSALLADPRMSWRAEAGRIAAAYDWDRVVEQLLGVYARVRVASGRVARDERTSDERRVPSGEWRVPSGE
jgi:phosphatidyl-myo-inositol alpha-mannosyltransferase